MTPKPRYQHSFNLDEETQKRLASLLQRGVKIIEIILAGIENKEKESKTRKP